MSLEKRRRLKKRARASRPKKEKKDKRQRANPKKKITNEEIEARKRAQRIGMFDKKKPTYTK